MAEFLVETAYLAKGKLHQMLVRMKWLTLFIVDQTPDRSLDARDHTYTEPTTTGYAKADVSGHSAADPSTYDVDANYTAYRDLPTVEFVCTATSAEQYVYGFTVTEDDGAILGAQRGESAFLPLPFWRAGDRIRVTLRVTQESYGPPPPPAP